MQLGAAGRQLGTHLLHRPTRYPKDTLNAQDLVAVPPLPSLTRPVCVFFIRQVILSRSLKQYAICPLIDLFNHTSAAQVCVCVCVGRVFMPKAWVGGRRWWWRYKCLERGVGGGWAEVRWLTHGATGSGRRWSW